MRQKSKSASEKSAEYSKIDGEGGFLRKRASQEMREIKDPLLLTVVSGADGRTVNLSTLTGHLSSPTGQVSGCFDLILDMQPTPSFAGQQLPVGYYAPGEDPLLFHI
jgi:hypothetical protein